MSFIAAEGSTENPIIPPLPEIIIGLISIGIVFFILMKFVWPQFEKAYAARAEAIEGGIARAEQAQSEAKAALEKYTAQLAEARTEAAQIRDDARGEGQRIVEEMRASAQEEAARIVARGDEQLQVQRQQVVTELRQQVGQMSVQLAGRLIGESLEDDTRTQGTIDRFLSELEGMSAPAGEQS